MDTTPSRGPADADRGSGSGPAVPSASGVLAAPTPAARRRLVATVFGVALAVVTIDQVTKAWALTGLADGRRRDLVGWMFGLELTRNPGAAFSMATGVTWLFTLIAAATVVVIVRLSGRLGSGAWALVLGLLLGGAAGNLCDRLFRPPSFGRGHVIDFLALPHFPLFNLADTSITCAAVLIGWLGLRGIGLDGSRS